MTRGIASMAYSIVRENGSTSSFTRSLFISTLHRGGASYTRGHGTYSSVSRYLARYRAYHRGNGSSGRGRPGSHIGRHSTMVLLPRTGVRFTTRASGGICGARYC